MELYINKLYSALKGDLPGLKAHVTMSPLKRPVGNFPERKHARLSAVAIILREIEGIPSIILTQRNTYQGAHSGQISFPGGKHEPFDKTLEETARRESYEEIGIALNDNELIGKLTEVFIPVSGFLVQPFLYQSTNSFIPNADSREVCELIYLPVEVLLDDKTLSKMELRVNDGMIQKNVPCFAYGEKQIWGATALMLNELKFLLKY